MLKTIFTLLLLCVFVLSAQASSPIKKNNVEQAVRFQVIQNSRTAQFDNSTRTRTVAYDVRTRTFVDNSSAQLENLGSVYGYSKSNTQLDNLGSVYGYTKSNTQLDNLGSVYGYTKSNTQLDNLGSVYGYSK